MRAAVTIVSLITLLQVLLCGSAQAQALSAAQAQVSGDHRELSDLVKVTAKSGAKFKLPKFRVDRVENIGSITFVLNERKLPGAEAVMERNGKSQRDHVVPALFKGYALLNRSSGDSRRVPVALSVIKNQAQLRFSSNYSDHQARAARLYVLTWSITRQGAAVVSVASTPNAAVRSKGCEAGEHRPELHNNQLSAMSAKLGAVAKTLESRRVVTISTQADPAWYAIYGDSSNAVIASIINAAEAIYERQLGIRFRIVRQHVYTDQTPYNTTDSSLMLAAFSKNPENPAHLGYSPLNFDAEVDVKHLFTGVDLDGNVVGLSYVGAVCLSPKHAYGLTQNTNHQINVAAFAHEIGHNFGASHDSSDPGGLMYPVLSASDRFSAASVAAISATLARASCVEQEMVSPNLNNAKINLTQKRARNGRFVQVRGELISNTMTPISGELVTLTVNGKAVPLMTNAAGVFSYRLSLAQVKSKKVTVTAQTSNNELAQASALKVRVRA
ncbi:MAG: M12 family metallo-peptidase [Pseudomonadota bacterium]